MVAATKRGQVTFVRSTDPSPGDLPETFVDRYAAWASGATDAPTQYHRATGVTILSTIMTPHLVLHTRFGPIIPNIWMMVLAGTTLTRKSTSLNLAARLLNDVTDDWMLATDGSAEGILTELAFRDGKISVFLRDEITGFMSSVSSRDYLSGMLEAFTQLYDGTPQTRLLRRERIEIKNPYFVFMGGGIKTRMEEIVSMEHIRSGFLPRFLFVTGSTTRDQVRPIGPPDDDELDETGESARDDLVNELWGINDYYTHTNDASEKPLIKIGGVVKVSSSATSTPKKIKLRGSKAFWDRAVQLNDDAMDMGETSSSPELYTPLYVRLANTVLKVAMLLCGADRREIIEVEDLYKAISLSTEWVEAVTDFATAIEAQPEMDKWERKVDKIVQYIKAQHPNTLTQTQILQKFRIRKKDVPDIEGTMMARGVIDITPWPHPNNMSGTKIIYSLNPKVHGNKLRPTPLNRIQKEDSYIASDSGHEETDYTYSKRNGSRIAIRQPRKRPGTPLPNQGEEDVQ